MVEHEKYTVRDKRKPGWFWVNREILEHFAPIIKPSGIAVYCVLCLHADNNSQRCYPSHATLAALTGLSTRAIPDVLARLVEAGLIHVESRAAAGKSNVYTLLDVGSAMTAGGYATSSGGYATTADELDSILDSRTTGAAIAAATPSRSRGVALEKLRTAALKGILGVLVRY